ncbi:MAG: hypothetical protein KatS3mg109_1306 [Pirellulaceae bacterium]|nr:MAG: hypothetical protein KatS3mg109_1306 [Pirellulaceae bacterium]GIW92716.1 MAG: hypothetical protein KatS3mg110_0757 [Pirellulaceae bacterium]
MGLSSPLSLCLLYSILAVLVRLRFRKRWATLFLCGVLAVCAAVIWRYYRKPLYNLWQTAAVRLVPNDSPPGPWPPEVGRPFPDLLLSDSGGWLTRISRFRGKVLLVELVAAGSPASVALAGGHAYGPFEGVAPQANLQSLTQYLATFGQVDVRHPDLIHVRIMILNRHAQPPSAHDLRQWERHFNLGEQPNAVTLAAPPELVTEAARRLAPGFYLVDRNFVVKAESCGIRPKHDFYTYVIPLLHDLLEETSH